ncbi:hypothetical protein BN1723_005784, partial [Verticillium longisporum]
MGSVEASTRLLQLDEPRPPTPPREARLGADTNAAKPLLVRAASADSRSKLNTPPGLSTPDPSTNNTNPNTSRSRKRVGFTALLEAPRNTHDKKGRRSSPPSASQPRPAKGILKITASPSPHELSLMADDSDLLGPANMSDMLESTVRQLAGTDRDAKTDAYMMLVRALQASNNLPDRVALQSKMGLFVQFIQRDIVAKTPAGTSDSPLISKALTLLDTFLFFPAIASTIPSDFGIFIVDHCIRSFEDPALPKDLARRLMHVMAKQDFPLRVMTSDRIKRLVSALHAMDGPSRGKMVVVSRLRIYARLMIQTKAYMAVHTEWLNDVLTDMLSSVKDVRNSAIKLGFEASFVFGREKLLQRKFMDLLEMSIEEMTYIEWYHAQLQEMIKGDSQDKAAVPKIWSVIILLLQYPLNKWRYFNPSLMIIQKCFNVAESNREANYAWNRYVYTAHLDEPTFHKVLPTLFMPLASQLSKSTVSPVKRELVMGGLCNLYYYAFKPNTNPAHLDAYWDVSVQPLTDALVPSANIPDTLDLHLQRATAILIGLLDSSTLRIWRDDRIKDSPIAKPEELPVIDSKWVRRNAPRVFKVISPIMDKHFCQLADRTSSIHKLWRALVGSVAFAASKEIKVSTDTATFVSEMFGLLLKHWQTGISTEGDTTETARQFVRAVQEMVLTAVESLGLLPFTEKMISLGRLSSFIPVATPSHRGLSTPDPSTNNTNPNTSRSRKRVGFTALLEAPRNTLDKKGRRSSPLSASQPRPAKGILKITASPSPHELSLMADDSELLGPANMSDMLESTMRQLAGTDRDAKTDAYMMLVRALQASNNLPDRVALQSKMGLFVQFIQRDIVAKTPAGTSDSPLISKALTLLDTFLFFPAIASTIPSDFGIFIVDHCIRSFEDPALPKDLARRLMHVMAKQDFPLRVMTSDRIKRLVSALHAMDGPSRGKMVVVSRLRIYARLMIQTKAYMAVHTEWLNDVLTDMLSSVKDVRNSAIKLGFEASFVFGREKLLQRKFMDLLEMSIEEMTVWHHFLVGHVEGMKPRQVWLRAAFQRGFPLL